VATSIAPQISELVEGRSLGATGAADVLEKILSGTCPPEQVAAFLVALAAKGPTTDELVGMLDTLDAHRVPLELADDLARRAVDVVGTGGDGLDTVNVSTMAALVVAGVGVPVVKHGNRKASSQVGAADVLEALGVAVAPGPAVVARCVEEAGFGFCFAPAFHPALAVVAPVRAALGVRTVFNFLGPLANPARVPRLLLGVSDPLLVDLIAAVMADRGIRHGLVVRGDDGVDEVSISTRSRIVEVTTDAAGDVSLSESFLEPTSHGIDRAPIDAIRGGDAHANASVARDVLRGVHGPARDVVVLNAAAALVAAEHCDGIDAGLASARESVDSGAAARVLDGVVAITTSN
jgi:anthranilate phosphoribosyltransferase